MKLKQSYIFVFLLSIFIFTGCGSDNGGGEFVNDSNRTVDSNTTLDTNTTVDKKTKGYLIDSPLQGVTYICDGNEALTNEDGMFECVNAPVTFKVGALTLGTLTAFTADGKVYPQDLLKLARDNYSNSKLKLLARLVQSLDDDGNIKDKITITQSVRDSISKEQNFKDMSANDVSSLLSGIGKTFVQECGAMKHLGDKSVNCNSDGSYYVDTYVPPVVTPTPTPTPTSQKSTITGYAEDDPMPNAKVKVTDKDNNIVAQVTADANGKYSLEGKFEEGKVYTLESKGKIADKNVTLHSIFEFDKDTVINANPITELKYQLVEEGKSIDEAEKLIRDYFSVVNGEKLERNRFDIEGSLALGMIDLAKLYDGVLPIDAIAKIKEDILRNAPLEVKDYSYRTILQEKIALEVSTTTVEVGNDVNITISGLKELHNNYMIKWSGTPSSEENKTSIKFTMENPQDVYVRASVYKVDGNRTKLITSADTTINFYKLGTESNVTVENASVDNNFSIGENSITVPAGTVTDGKVIKVRELNTGSDKTVAQFEVDAGGAVDGNITFNYKYDPYLVAEPRNLQISLRSGNDVKVLKVIEIDYAEHIVRFGIPLSRGITRRANDNPFFIIEKVTTKPNKREILKFTNEQENYLRKIIATFFNSDATDKAMKDLLSDEGIGKLTKILQSKRNGTYNFNILATCINNIIAYEKAKKLNDENSRNFTSWQNAIESYFRWKYDGTKDSNGDFRHFYLNSPDPIFTKNLDYNTFTSKIMDMNTIISLWVGNVKLTSTQDSGLKISKFIVAEGMAFTSGDMVSIFTNIAEVGVDYIQPNYLSTSDIGFAYNRLKDASTIYNAFQTEIGGVNIKLLKVVKAFTIGALVDGFFKEVEYGMIKSNTIKTAPIFISLSTKYPNLKFYKKNGFLMSSAMRKKDFINFLFPSQDGDGLIDTFYNENRKILFEAPMYSLGGKNEESQLSSKLDINKRLQTLFLTKYPSVEDTMIDFLPNTDESWISDSNRALAYTLIQYAYGDTSASTIFEKIKDSSIDEGFKLLLSSLYLPKTEIYDVIDTRCENNTQYEACISESKIKSEYKITNYDRLMVYFGRTNKTIRSRSISEISELKNISSFGKIMELTKLKLTNDQLEKINIKKVKMETYGVGLEYSDADNAWTLDRSVKEHHIYETSDNINSKFTYDSDLEKNVLSFATLFDGEDFTLFDNKLVGFKVTLVVEINGVEKVISKDFIFTTLADTEHLVETDFTGAKLKSSAKDASTGSPIANAQVTLVPGGLTDFTDAEGNYEVSGLAAGNYTIIISKEGYRQVEATLALVEDETKVFEASLAIDDEHATSLGGANITLKDAINGNVITNGYIKVRNGQNNKTGEVVYEVTNDGNNSLNIELYPNVYTVEVGANGYSKSFNTITIVGDTNNTYEFSVSPILAEDQVRVVLTWGENPSDLDSHLVRLSDNNVDYHVYYSNMRPANADANLDTDDTSSYGPETITISGLSNASTYRYYVHDFSNGSNHNDEIFKASGAKVEVYYGDQSKTFYVPNENGNAWKVFEIVNGEIIPCTTGCMFGVDGDSDTNIGLRKLDRNALDKRYFRNLPAK